VAQRLTRNKLLFIQLLAAAAVSLKATKDNNILKTKISKGEQKFCTSQEIERCFEDLTLMPSTKLTDMMLDFCIYFLLAARPFRPLPNHPGA
jgi:hypothetical protein